MSESESIPKNIYRYKFSAILEAKQFLVKKSWTHLEYYRSGPSLVNLILAFDFFHFAYYFLIFSSQDVAKDLELLLRHGITHVVNVATGVGCLFPDRITYLALTAFDEPTDNLKQHFQAATEFMRKAVEEEKGKVKINMEKIKT